jgi:hypothetical protein
VRTGGHVSREVASGEESRSVKVGLPGELGLSGKIGKMTEIDISGELCRS